MTRHRIHFYRLKTKNIIFSNVRGNVLDSPDRGFIFRQNIVPGDSLSLTRAIIDGRLDWKYRRARQQAKVMFLDND